MSKFLKAHTKNRAALAFATISPMALGALTVTSAGLVNADTISGNGQAMVLAKNVTAGSFDLTKQVGSNMNFPIAFDRPSGVNAAAIAGTVTQLGAGSTLYKSALKAVPELSNTVKMNSLLSDALDPSSANHASARANIVKLINWYNSLGGQQIKTQAGAAYTTANLDQPINVLAVAFSNDNNINSSATKALAALNNAKTVGDVEKALESYQSGVSTPYETAFSAYAAKVYAKDADLNALSQYSAAKPVLDAYQSMYAKGASAIRTTLLNGSATSAEAGVTFFESAVLAGSTNGSTETVSYTTKWVDESGHPLAAPEHSTTGYAGQKDIPNYTFETSKTDNSTNTKTYVYKPVPKTADTTWVDEHGKTLKPSAKGTLPDKDGVSDVPGYVVVSTKTTKDGNGNSHTVNTYHKVASDTTWVDTNGKTLKAKADGLFPDNDGKSDIKGYNLVSVKTNTDANGDKHVINTYQKATVQTHTTWVDTADKMLKPQQSGNLPDTDHNDIPGYTWVNTITDRDGNTINTYKKTALPNTYWFDTDGRSLKAEAVGQTLPDTNHNDISGYTWQLTYTVTADDLKQGGTFHDSGFVKGDTINIYKKNADVKKVHTNWVDTKGNKLKDQENGLRLDNDGTSDIPGYALVQTKTDADGNVTNVYEKNSVPKTVHTNWVDTENNKLKGQEDGSFPDDDGTSDIPGYTLVRTKTDTDGNVTNVYEKTSVPKTVYTDWIDTDGNTLKDQEDGSFPDDDGTSDIPGYTFVQTKTDADGNVTNVYEKTPVPKTVHTDWVDTDGNTLKDQEDGSHPDNDGTSDIPDYILLRTDTDRDGNVTNVYEKTSVPKTVHTDWIDTNGNTLKDQEDGSSPDNDGTSDIPGYTLVRTKTDADNNVTNVYEKTLPKTVHTDRVNTENSKLKGQEDVSSPNDYGYSKDVQSDPALDSTQDPTQDPTLDSTQDPTLDSTQDPTLDSTQDPTLDSTSQPEQPSSDKTLPQSGMNNQAADELTFAGMGIIGALGIGDLIAKRRRRKNIKSTMPD